MRLLIVTDHVFLGTDHGVYDTFCFDRAFFDDYRALFEEVLVAARVQEAPRLTTAARSDGDGVEFIRLPPARGLRKLFLAQFLYRKRLDAVIHKVDAVCVRIPSLSGSIAFQLAMQASKPVMFELIGDPLATLHVEEYGLLANMFGYWSARHVRSITSGCKIGSYVSAHHLQTRYPPCSGALCDSISSIRLPLVSIAPAKRSDKCPEPLKLVCVGSLVPVKCHATLLRGMAEATKRHVPVTLQLVGDGPLRRRLERLSESLGLSDKVAFHGHIAVRSQLVSILDACNLFVLASASEGMPRAMLEAMASGLAAIGSNVGGIAELLPATQRFAKGDYKALAHLLEMLHKEPLLLNKCAENSERTVRQYTEDKLSLRRRRLLAALRELATEKTNSA